MQTINCNGKLLDLSTPRVMGIINVTPDSFYDGGTTISSEAILKQARKMLSEGAAILDVGGYSSRPGASTVSEAEELKRVLPAIENILAEFPDTILSIDTFRAAVAKEAVIKGAAIVNDISGGRLDDTMYTTVSQLGVPYILMHMRGTPQTMAQEAKYEDVTQEVLFYFSEKLTLARQAGINDIIADPGFCFAKTRQQSFELLNQLDQFQNLEIPFLAGISRKSMVYKTLESTPEEALNGTTALNTIALLKGASILRVHDVREAVECITLVQNLKSNS
ncbi:dihydropteroate synthase [Altibacter sp.]|uniref:dihydropteroate synthase n=1 Tax=Altibacter sp. TaxID=2024823 RepID=UPI0025861F01|nr:dihydropteroate synthase [Altibacter sp.]MCW9037437.1 dihydropteroate synthase [Altibacter sp.]